VAEQVSFRKTSSTRSCAYPNTGRHAANRSCGSTISTKRTLKPPQDVLVIVEIGHFIALPGKEDLFRDALKRARSVLSRAPGYGGSTFYQSIENPRRFCLVVLWDNIGAHMKTFREGPLFLEWRQHLNPFMDVDAIQPGISFSHFTAIAEGEPIE